MVYRLTPKAHTFFPSASNGATIEILNAANRLYGHAAAEKLLYSVFTAKTEELHAEAARADCFGTG